MEILNLKNKNIIIINNNMKIGGVQKSLLNLVKEISKDNNVTLLLYAPVGAYMNMLPENVKTIDAGKIMSILGLSHSEAKRCGLGVISTFFRAITKVLGFPLVIRLMMLFSRKIKTEYDIAISYLQDSATKKFYGGCNLYTIKKVKSKKYITFIHSDYSCFGGNTKHNINILSKFDEIALVSKSCKSIFDSMVPHLSYKSMVVYNQIDENGVLALANDTPVVYNKTKIQLISVSRITHEKGLERLVQAFNKVERCYSDKLELHIVGDGKMFDEINNLVMQLKLNDKIFFHGEQYNPYRYMKNADILVISSYQEAAPMVIGEAYALGLKVLSTKTSSAEEMIDKDHGWVCENSEEGLTSALCDIAKEGNGRL